MLYMFHMPCYPNKINVSNPHPAGWLANTGMRWVPLVVEINYEKKRIMSAFISTDLTLKLTSFIVDLTWILFSILISLTLIFAYLYWRDNEVISICRNLTLALV
jgi:hypothetical protein